MAATLVGRLASKAVSQGRCLVPWILGRTDNGERAGDEQAAQIAVTLFAYIAEPVLASARMLLSAPAQSQAEKLRPDRKDLDRQRLRPQQ